MRGLIRVVVLAGVLCSAAAGCVGAENPALLPAGEAPTSDVLTGAQVGDAAPADEIPSAAADTTGRWGGGLGSGT